LVVTPDPPVQEHPKVRPLEAFPVEHEGREMIGLKDPVGLSPAVVFVPQETFYLLTLMDGTRDLADLQAAYMRRFGTLLFTDKLQELIEQLNTHYLLENRRFQSYVGQMHADFKDQLIREAAFANRGYAGDPALLKAQLQGYFTGEQGPGLPVEGGEKKTIKGLAAPHIDFTRGGACYAHAYKALAEALPADLYVILGTCHTPMQHPFAFTQKAFATPLGLAEADKGLIEAVAAELPFDPFADEFSHRSEHTIEFQVVFLQHLLEKKPFKIFPILCGSLHEQISQGISPWEDPNYQKALSVLKQRCSAHGKTCVIASADLAHVGPQFGQREKITRGILAEVKQKDLEMLRQVEEVNAEGFYRAIQREGDRRNICGLPPIYALLHVIEANNGKIVNYQQWSDAQGQGAVTFAGMTFS
jgi:AmmeMemoRadiSam system protein B